MAQMLTNSVKPLELENILDPRLEALNQDRLKWGIFKGCENQNYMQQQANSYGTTGINWNFNTQSESVLIDRRMYAESQFQITFTGTSPIGQPLLNDEYDAPRAFPLLSITNSLKVSINGTSVEMQYADSMLGLLRYNAEYDLFEYDLSQTPNYLDIYQNLADGQGSNRNPMGNFFNSPYKIGRGAFKLDSIVNPVSVDGVTPTTSIVVFTVIEPLLISPMLYNAGDLQSGLLGVKNFGVSYGFKAGQLNRIWSHGANPGVNITNATVAIGAGATTSPKLHINYLNPPLIDFGLQPTQIVYQYYHTETNINDMNTTLAPNVSRTFTNNAQQISTVPKSIYIFVTQPNSDKDYTSSDTFFRINSLSLQYLNTAGQFSSMDAHDLYIMGVKNGLKQSWTEYNGLTQQLSNGTVTGLTGSVLRIDVEDLAIPSNLASGVNTNSQLSYTINVTNINQTETLGVQITTVLVYDGVCTVTNGTMITNIGIIDQGDVVRTRQKGSWVEFKSAQSLYGGDFFSKIKSLAKSTQRGLDKICKLSKMSKIMGGAEVGGSIIGGRCPNGTRKGCNAYTKKPAKKEKAKKPKKAKGGEIMYEDDEYEGGMMMTREELRDRLM